MLTLKPSIVESYRLEVRGTEAGLPVGTIEPHPGNEEESDEQVILGTDAGPPVGADESHTHVSTVVPHSNQEQTHGDENSPEDDGYEKVGICGSHGHSRICRIRLWKREYSAV